MKNLYLKIKYRYPVWKIKFQMWIAWKMPKWLVTMCAVRVISHASTTDYSNTVMGDITAVDAYQSWCNKK